jgi:flagellar basal-body rod protein FlgF
MVGMISAARQFEMQMRMITTADTNARSAAQLLSLGN